MSAVFEELSRHAMTPPAKPRKEQKLRPVLPYIANPWDLSGMQCAVLILLVQGKTAKGIGSDLGISHKTVEVHLQRAKDKMCASNALHAALMWDRLFREKTTAAVAMVPNRWYLAGPMTGINDLNFPAFHRQAARLRAEGLEVINPAEINADPTAGWSACLRADIAQLVTCEGIALMPDWKFSKGATLEHHNAQSLGLKVRYLDLLA